ncbi:MAG TPA: DUF1552 domain-containing protein [Vicinamibacterales bacterium]|jgi:hypothetical protein|nr:DUF1552 domain-containing protein [Vicinamibacterales bacterium]
MIITKKALSRRTVLKGMGVSLALPMLDAMVPALTAASSAAAPARRYGFFYMPNGVAMNHTGANFWKPQTVGADFEFSPILQSLEPFRNQVTIVSGLHNRAAESLGDGNGDHTRSTASWLTGAHIKRTEGSDLRAGTSVDQAIAAQFKKDTPLPSLELAILPNSVTGGCDTGYSCAYGTTLAWASSTTPLPTQSSPRLVFEQLFGDGGPASAQLAATRQKNSIIDSAIEEMNKLKAKLGAKDRGAVSDYLDVLREVERRIQQTEAKNAASPLPEYDRPGIGTPERFDDHAKLMFDLQHLAFQGDITRVTTFMYGGEQRARMYPEIGLNESHHSMSHHGDNPENLRKYAKLCTWHVELFAYLVEKMRNTPDGDGTLLDHSMLMIGGGMSNGNIHSHMDVPIALVGGGIGLKGNRHVATQMGTPLSNLLVTLANGAGVPIDSFGDSTGTLDLNAGPAGRKPPASSA